MDGKLKKLKNAQNEYMYPITVSEAVYVDPDTSLKTLLAEMGSKIGSPNSYVIEMDRWNIHNDGTDAAATTQGINDALIWAKSSGYNHVLLPAGTYNLVIDTNGVAINMLSGIHFEMKSGCVLQLEGNSSPNYRIIQMQQISHAKVTGGQIVGDKATHQYELSIGFVRGGVNADGSLNDDPNFIRSEVIDRYAHAGLLANFRLWSIAGISAGNYSFYQYKDTVSKDTLVNFRTNGEFAPAAPTGRGWFDTIDKANKMIFVIDISSSPLTDAQIAQIRAKVDSSYYTHEGGYGVAVVSSNHIEVGGIEISHCTGDGVFTGIGVRYEDPSRYIQEEIGQHIYIHDCHIHHCRRQGISLCGPNDVFVVNNTIHHIGYADDGVTTDFRNGTAPMFGIDVESMVGESNIPFKSIYLNQDGLETNYRIYIYNNYIHHNAKGHFVNVDGTHITLQNNTFEGYNIGGISSYPTQWHIKYLNNTFIQCTLVVKGNNVVNGAVFQKANLNLLDVQGAMIDNCQIKDGLFYGSSIYGYLGTPSAIDTATGTFTYKAPHGMGNGAQVCFEQWFGRVPAGISVDKVYYTVNVTATSFQVSEIRGGSPVVLTDGGVTGFNLSRYNYGRCYISNITVETDWSDTTGNIGFMPLIAGAVLTNIKVKNGSVSIKAPDNYVGRPNIVTGLTLLESGGILQASDISNMKVLKVRSKAMGGDVTLGSLTPYSRVNIDSALFQGVQVNLEEAYLTNGTFINNILYKQDRTNKSVIMSSYMENTSLSLHWITNENSITITKCLFNNVSIDASASVKFMDNYNINTGLPDNRMSAPPSGGRYVLGQIIYNSSPKPGGYVGWICTTEGYVANQAWAASKAFAQGARIQAGGHVYEAVTAGTSGTVPPVFPTANGGTVTDNTLIWKEIGLLAVFNTFAPISAN